MDGLFMVSVFRQLKTFVVKDGGFSVFRVSGFGTFFGACLAWFCSGCRCEDSAAESRTCILAFQSPCFNLPGCPALQLPGVPLPVVLKTVSSGSGVFGLWVCMNYFSTWRKGCLWIFF